MDNGEIGRLPERMGGEGVVGVAPDVGGDSRRDGKPFPCEPVPEAGAEPGEAARGRGEVDDWFPCPVLAGGETGVARREVGPVSHAMHGDVVAGESERIRLLLRTWGGAEVPGNVNADTSHQANWSSEM